jgi:imidazolonepropionase-like amidohydrolase
LLAFFTPLEALQTATVNPARFLEIEESSGTVEKGKSADLVLLDANSLTDIGNTQKIARWCLTEDIFRRRS